MAGIAVAIAPIFLMILLGYGLRRGGIPSVEFWNLNDRLVYWVLMPALFFRQISVADLGASAIGPFAAALCAGFFAAAAFGLVAARAAGYAPPVASSVVQGACRFNTFVALAIAEALHGTAGLQLAVLAAALLVPVVNVTIVVLLTFMLGQGGGGLVRRSLRDLARNPLILSIALALVANLGGLGGLPVIDDTAAILGAAALPVMLLCVGANLRVAGMRAAAPPLALAAVGKLAVFPLAMLAVLALVPPGALAAQVALIYGALPTGVAAYTLARAMGGDAPLMAAIITVQTLLAFVTIPLTLTLGARLLGL
jgi:malonate transporter and related proteins